MRLPPSRPFSSMEVWLARSFRMLMKTSTQKSATGLESPTGTKALRPVHSQPFSSTARYVLCTLVPLKTTLALCASWKNAGSRGSVRTRDLPTHVVKRWKSRSEEHTSELQSRQYLVCRLLLEKKKQDK